MIVTEALIVAGIAAGVSVVTNAVSSFLVLKKVEDDTTELKKEISNEVGNHVARSKKSFGTIQAGLDDAKQELKKSLETASQLGAQLMSQHVSLAAKVNNLSDRTEQSSEALASLSQTVANLSAKSGPLLTRDEAEKKHAETVSAFNGLSARLDEKLKGCRESADRATVLAQEAKASVDALVAQASQLPVQQPVEQTVIVEQPGDQQSETARKGGRRKAA